MASVKSDLKDIYGKIDELSQYVKGLDEKIQLIFPKNKDPRDYDERGPTTHDDEKGETHEEEKEREQEDDDTQASEGDRENKEKRVYGENDIFTQSQVVIFTQHSKFIYLLIYLCLFIQFQVVVYGEWGFLNHTSQELRDMEVEEEAGMYDDDVVVTQDIVDRVKEQAIIISDSPEKHRIRRPPATYTPTPKSRPYVLFTTGPKKMPSPYPLSDPTAPPSVDDVDVMTKWLEVGLKPGYKKTNVKIKYNDFEESLSPSWDFRDVCISSKTWFYTLWTADEWLTDEVP